MALRRLGLFGGTFDPPHLGHLLVASDAYEALDLDRLVFVPAADPPHKRGAALSPPGVRLEMMRAAVRGDPRFDVDDLEIRRGGTSFTVDTLRELKAREPDAELVFLLGIDQFRDLAAWRQPEEVARLARLGVLSRGGETPDLAGPYGGESVPVRRVDISATEIRDRVRRGLAVRYLVPPPVLELIEQRRLYR